MQYRRRFISRPNTEETQKTLKHEFIHNPKTKKIKINTKKPHLIIPIVKYILKLSTIFISKSRLFLGPDNRANVKLATGLKLEPMVGKNK